MDGGFRVASLAGLPLVEVVDLVNRGYADYPGPFSPEDATSYAAFCRTQGIDLARSVVARDARDAPVGLGLLGLRGVRGWVGDFAVVPAWRRRGVGRALLAALLDSARQAGARDVRLEVAAANHAAQQLYTAAGFRILRTLHNYSATAGGLGLPHVEGPAGLTLAGADPAILVRDLGLPAEPAPTWDHELPALLTAGATRTLLAAAGDMPVGLLHYAPGADDAEILRLAVRPDSPAVARALLAATTGNPATRILVPYVTEDSPLFALLPALGFQETAPDLEMCCDL